MLDARSRKKAAPQALDQENGLTFHIASYTDDKSLLFARKQRKRINP
jgi:hypothetical protein